MGTFDQTIPLILIVEDDYDARTIYSDSLTHAGYRTLVAASGEAALAKAHPPDVALVDIVMPGMSGREVVASPGSANFPRFFRIFGDFCGTIMLLHPTQRNRHDRRIETLNRFAPDADDHRHLAMKASDPQILRIRVLNGKRLS